MDAMDRDRDLKDDAADDEVLAGPCPICGGRGWYEDGDGNQAPCAICEAIDVD
jgi:hypothetical protein